MKEKKTQFASRLGVIAVMVGTAVGLGNIWRFPYEAGANGGAAFMLLNFVLVFLLGVPLICGEFIIGRGSGVNVRQAFARLGGKNRGWGLVGYIGIASSVLILSFYSVIAGWTIEYFVESITGFSGATTTVELHENFERFVSSDWRPVMWTWIFLGCNFLILIRGVQKGIERLSSIFMPVLFLLLIVFCIHSLMLPEAGEGLKFLFAPDFSCLTPKVVLSAMGQVFFSLSLGLGALITYASYFKQETPLVKTAAVTAILDLLIAILAGVIIFPAVFSFHQEPTAGPRLVFEVLPSIFVGMPYGQVWAALFFLLLFLASLTSTLSMFEIFVAYLEQEFGLSRFKAVSVNLLIALVLSALCSASFGTLSGFRIFGLTIFELFDNFTSNILLPIGGLLIALFVGWKLPKSLVMKELEKGTRLQGGAPGRSGSSFVNEAILLSLRYFAPLCILLIFLWGLLKP